jgi:hypothetical protein
MKHTLEEWTGHRTPLTFRGLLLRLLCLLLLALLVVAVCSCALTVSPDGTRTWSMSGQEAARAIIILSDK